MALSNRRPDPMPGDEKSRAGRIERARRVARELKEDPRLVLPALRGVLLDVWRSRGGGFYGLGYIVAFVYYEIDMLIGDLSEASSMSEFALGQTLEIVFRLTFMSFVNAFQALLWPLMVLQLYEGLGIILLVGSYLAFEHLLKPAVERMFPELPEHRELKLEGKRQKQARKQARKQRKKNAADTNRQQ